MSPLSQFRAKLALFMLAAEKDEKPRSNFIDPLSKKDEEILGKIWDSRKKGQKKKALDEGGEEDAKGGKGGFFGTAGFREFWKDVYEDGKKKFPNSNPKTKKTHPQVSANTLLKSSKAFRDKVLKDYAKWRDGQKEDKDKKDTGSSGGLKLAKDRYKNTQFKVNDRARKMLDDLGVTPEKLADIAGIGILSSSGDRKVTIMGSNSGIIVDATFELDVGGTVEISRVLDFASKTLKNDALAIKGAPKGIGTKVFASQIQEARAAGFKAVECDALTAPPKWVGGLVWPKLGYDAGLPEPPEEEDHEGDAVGWPEDVYEKATDMLEEQGFSKPFKISMLMQSKEGRDFWAEHVPKWVKGFSFDLQPSSQSSTVLQQYLEAKGLT